MPKKYRIELTEEERNKLEEITRRGKHPRRTAIRARVLLKADQGEGGPQWRDKDIAEALDIGKSSIERLRERFVEEGLEASLRGRPRTRVYERKLDGKAEARLVAVACTDPPEGRVRWTMELLADKLIELKVVDKVHPSTVCRTLKKMNLSLG